MSEQDATEETAVAPAPKAARQLVPFPKDGRGVGGKGMGKKFSGNLAKRHQKARKVLRDNVFGITAPAIRRLARRGGVKRISNLSYEEVRGVLKDFLKKVIGTTVIYTENAHRKTVIPSDVVHALVKEFNMTLYGYDGSRSILFS